MTRLVYHLLFEEWSDSIVSDILGLKKMQIQGVRNLGAALIEALEIDTVGVNWRQAHAEVHLSHLLIGTVAFALQETPMA